MAVKKKAASKTSPVSVAAAKAAPVKSAAKQPAAPKKSAAKPASATIASATAPKAGTPKAASAPKSAAPKKAAPVPVKLTDRQQDLLKMIYQTSATGYLADKKAEVKTLDALANKKLIKKGAKDKASGHVRYHVSKAGEKFLSTASAPA